MNAAGQAKALLLIDKRISHFIHFSLALALGGWMRIFRQCLFVEIYLLSGRAPRCFFEGGTTESVAAYYNLRRLGKARSALAGGNVLPSEWRLG